MHALTNISSVSTVYQLAIPDYRKGGEKVHRDWTVERSWAREKSGRTDYGVWGNKR